MSIKLCKQQVVCVHHFTKAVSRKQGVSIPLVLNVAVFEPAAILGVIMARKGKKEALMSDDIVYTADIRIERIKGPFRKAYLPVESEPVAFGVHSEIAEHYKVDPQVHDPHSTTIDYVIAAAGG